MKRRNGFTLVELLAVIVILAIIALIAVPIIMNVIRDARKKSAIESFRGYMDAVEKTVIRDSMKTTSDLPSKDTNGCYNLKELNEKVKVKGSKPIIDNDDTLCMENGKIKSISEVTISGYKLEYKDGKILVNGESAEQEQTPVVKTEYKEEILNGTDPVIKGQLVPVTIANNGTVKKADLYSEWYKYGSKKWANAVLLTGEDTYKAGDTIEESAIKAYFVWIPKYSYKIFNMGNYTTNDATTLGSPQTINIRFGTTNTSDSNDGECTTVATSGQSGNCAVNKYMTHPAFTTLGSVKGIWVGKFETTGSISALTVKPNSTPLTNQTVKAMFQAAYNYNRALDSHMMKNTEWGAVAYLSHSQYGINNEVRINNNSNKVTGCAASTSGASSVASCENAYNTSTGYLASTTGNITGVYDMSGGVYEYVAGFINNTPKSSGFATSDTEMGSSYNKYFDRYTTSQNKYKDYNYRILGDATGEMGPFNSSYQSSWYTDYAFFVSSSIPWFLRGGDYVSTTTAGQFYFDNNYGGSNSYFGFRLVLAD